MQNDNIVEIQIRKVDQLSDAAKSEVELKLSKQPDTFNFRGYAKVSYAESSPLRVFSVDPIEGTVIDYYHSIAKSIKQLK